MIIITGGAGFIGSALAKALNDRGQTDIVIIDRLGTDEKWKNLAGLGFADYFDADDFLEMAETDSIDFPIEAVLHMGACSATTETDASFLAKNNYEYTKAMAALALEFDARFIYASSAATYGNGENGFEDNHEKLKTLKPLNMYGYSKHLFDLWAKRNGLLDEIVGLKYFNVFGPNEYHKAEMRSFVIRAFEQISDAGKVKLFKSYNPDYPDGKQLRDFLYIKDAVDMTLFFLDNPKANGIFNIGSAAARSWLDLANAAFAAMDKKASIEFIDMPESLRDKYQYYTQADITKIRNAGYKQKTTSLEDAVKDYIQNYLAKNQHLTGI
ncbi:MAG: ADP-glyceromanno-heptose 6-epimerase [Anaerohalosphaeraceae bacterium]|nr:ADP-glyceromanno-heptose 6-epimerase [Anaerohalosphaeraceae bacterium]